MIKSLVLAALIAVTSVSVQAKAVAYADLNRGKTAIVLHDDQRTCKDGFLYASVRFAGRHLNACWRVLNTPGGVGVHIVDEEGDEGLISTSEFKPIKDL